MKRNIVFFAVLLLLIPMLVWGCAPEDVDPVEEPREEPVDEPIEPDEPLPSDPVDENGKPWMEEGLLEPEKTVTLVIEGMEEELTLQLHVSSQFPYALYLDEERYRLEEKDGKDHIHPRVDVEPEVYMAIEYREAVEITNLLSALEAELVGAGADVQVEGWGEHPLPALHIYGIHGSAWDDAVERFYLMEDGEDGVFIVQQKLFVEAVEGHGARFDGILEEFLVWNREKGQFLQPDLHK